MRNYIIYLHLIHNMELKYKFNYLKSTIPLDTYNMPCRVGAKTKILTNSYTDIFSLF
jgi:hypothetical protein